MMKVNLKPACEGLSRAETTSLLSRELVRLRLERRNAYSYWAHEVEISNHLDNGPDVRVDFVQFEPHSYHTCTDISGIELGKFTFYEVKSCLADLKSGHGLNFMGDVNWVVMPVELYEPYLIARGEDRQLERATADAGCLLYGKARNGRATFVEAHYFRSELFDDKAPADVYRHVFRKRAAAELLLCMMRAMIANSNHSDVDHRIERGDFQ